MNKPIRTVALILPVVILAVVAFVNLAATAVRTFLYWSIRKENYWTLENEWFQVEQDFESIYRFWQHG